MTTSPTSSRAVHDAAGAESQPKPPSTVPPRHPGLTAGDDLVVRPSTGFRIDVRRADRKSVDRREIAELAFEKVNGSVEAARSGPQAATALAVTVLPVSELMTGARRNDTSSPPSAVLVLVPTVTQPVARTRRSVRHRNTR